MGGITVSYNIELKINDDGTFKFKDKSSNVKGKWTEENNAFLYKEKSASIKGMLKDGKLHMKMSSGKSSFTCIMTK